MVTDKNITKIIAVLTAVAVVFCMAAVIFAGSYGTSSGDSGITMEYETALFGTDEPITVDILMDEDDWNDMLENAINEEYYCCDVVVNGETFKNVGIRPKGNTSLSSIVNDPDTERYSLKIEFDHYVEGQTCFGLNKLILNNNYADATNMKEAVIYDMYQYLGADASLYNYAKISVNGDYWGVYLALEAVEDSFLMRNYGTSGGNLYKPDSMDMGGGRGNGDQFDIDEFKEKMQQADAENTDGTVPEVKGDSSAETPDFPNGGGMPEMQGGDGGMPTPPDGADGDHGNPGGDGEGGFKMGGNGSDLNYTDDDLDSYSSIWDGEVNDTSKSDHKRVVTALKNISEGNDLETYMDVDNLLKYMAVHTFSVNMDSLSGNMAHNYYLYENNGQLNMIPWDYNLSFGGMNNMGGGGGPENNDMKKQENVSETDTVPDNAGTTDSASEMINFPIDTPFESTDFFNGLLENEEYLAQYHEYLRQLCEEYVQGGRLDSLMTRIHSQIDELVETDPTAFYTYDEYTEASDMLYETVKLRAESILGQLDGTIPSTDEGQKANPDALLDASSIDIECMGTMMGDKGDAGGGMKGGGMPGSFGGENAGGRGNFDKKQLT
jgi:spore coat protein CotH